jgi:hypothetical protein
MPKLRLGPSSTVFILFFLLALIEALQTRRWPLVIVFVALGVLSIVTDSLRTARKAPRAGRDHS